MADYIPDPANYVMKGNKPPVDYVRQSVPVRKNLTDEELKQIAREKLSELLQAIDANRHPSLLLSVLRETMDRIEGRPTQRIEQKVEHSSKLASSDLTNEQLLARLLQAEAAGMLPAGMKLIDSKLVTDADYQELDVVQPATEAGNY